MSREGVFNGFYFDREVFGDYMQEQSCINTAIMQSGILIDDPMLREMVGSKSNVGTVPFFLNADDETDALNHDGKTDNVPTDLKGSKQTFMAIARQKAWKETTFVRYLTGKSPLQNLADNLVVPFYTNQWLKDLLAIMEGITKNDKMLEHVTDLSTTSGTITDANMVSLTTHIDASQKALGDRRGSLSLFICHSTVATNLKKQELVTYRKYTDPSTLQSIELAMVGDMIVCETDNGTVDSTVAGFPVYKTFLIGRGTFLTAPKELDNPYYPKYDPEKSGGIAKIYTKQAKVIHPNGFSIKADEIVEESPTREELSKKENWELKFNHKNIAIVKILSNG